MEVQGVNVVLKNLDMASAEVALKVSEGLKEAGLFLQAESQKRVPVEFGNLKASAYTAAKGTGFETVVEVGYTADYAAFVHEKVEMKLKGQPRKPNPPHKGVYWEPLGKAQAKFLEEPARTLTPQLIQIVAAHAAL